MTPVRILFVDDEPYVLEGLKRMLHSQRGLWEVSMANSGSEALALLDQQPFDVVVTDMRMPEMDGAQLLLAVQEKHPQVIRIVLSGHSDQEAIFRTVGPAHQFLSKPCDVNTLKSTIERSLAMQNFIKREQLKNFASRLASIPSLPSLYWDIMAELGSPEPSLEKISRIVSRDVGMTMKIFQLVNSAFFGFYSKIKDIPQAIGVLGLTKLRALVLSFHIFKALDAKILERFNFPLLWHHHLCVAETSKAICLQKTGDKSLGDIAYTAGQLHDTGRLLLIASETASFQEALDQSARTGCTLEEAEQTVFTATHAEVGAYLLGLWGMPAPVTEAVLYHHTPRLCPSPPAMPLLAVHVADFLCTAAKPSFSVPFSPVDMDCLNESKLSEFLPAWKTLAESFASKEIAE